MKLDQRLLELHILSGREHTFASIVANYDAFHDEPKKMQIDRTLQKLRRKGLVRHWRKGQARLWQANTPSEQAEYLRKQSAIRQPPRRGGR